MGKTAAAESRAGIGVGSMARLLSGMAGCAGGTLTLYRTDVRNFLSAVSGQESAWLDGCILSASAQKNS